MRFEDLEVWQRACRLCVDIYQQLNECRDFSFKDQITRSALSISSNIAEGYERGTNKDAIKFFYYARGSAGELRTQLYIGIKIGYIPKQIGMNFKEEAEQISKMLSALIKARQS